MQVQRSFQGPGPRLYVCSTPIGNLDDVSFRLIETLKAVDVIAAEDTRHTQKLLNRFEIRGPKLVSFHEHNAHHRKEEFNKYWDAGKNVAVVSDAGTPLISDPGDQMVTWALHRNIPVVPVPGPSALLAALVACPFPVQPFAFVGFLPRDAKPFQEALKGYQTFPGALICYEAPHRVRKMLQRVAEIDDTIQVTLAKELTKQHETFYYGTVAELVEKLEAEPPRGEYVVVFEHPPRVTGGPGGEEDVLSDDERFQRAVERVFECITEGQTHGHAVRSVSQEYNVRRRQLYNETLGQQSVRDE